MELKSLEYLLFVFILIAVYFLTSKFKYQKYVLLAGDLIFIYLVSSIYTVFLIICLSLLVYLIAIQISRCVEQKKIFLTKIWLWIGILVDIGLLCYFKFFKSTWILLSDALKSQGINLWSLITPIGISYYSLALLGYMLDVYHKKYKPERNYLDFLNFVLFFPALFQGPINLYKKLSPQLKENHSFNIDNCIYGLQRILWGYLKKVVIADRIGILVSGILNDGSAYGVIIFYAFVLFSFQIYADFSGGIDVVMGISEIMGIQMTENFRQPLISKSVTEFWGRWHMSLGEWMEKYIYYPIVLNRKMMKVSKKIKKKYLAKVFSASIATFVVFVIVGIWHGTGWNYVAYGLYQAFWCTLAVLFGQFYKGSKKKIGLNENCISWKLFAILRTFVILVIGRYFSHAGSFTEAIFLLKKTFLAKPDLYKLFDGTIYNHGLDYKNLIVMYVGILLLIIVDILHEQKIKIREILMKQDIVFRYVVYLSALAVIIVFGIYGGEFSQSSFIYQTF